MFDSPDKQMSNMARSRARRVKKYTDETALAHDLVQEGWLAYLKYQRAKEPVRWLYVKRAMNEYWCKWVFNVRYSQVKTLKFMAPRPIENLDLTPLATLDPTIDQQIYAMELWRGFETEFSKLRRGNKITQMFYAMVLSEGERIDEKLSHSLGLSRFGHPERIKKIKHIYNQIIQDNI